MRCPGCQTENLEGARFCQKCGLRLTDAQEAEPQSLDSRRELLAKQIEMAVQRGGRVESQTDTMAVIVKGKPVNHILHLILSIITLGFWLIIWIILVITGGEKRETITIDDYARVSIQRV